jgi:hypothetical protein
MNTVPLEFDIGTSDPTCSLGVKVVLDGTTIYENSHVTQTYHLSHELSDEDGDHELTIEMYGKLPEHTKITESGDIVKDALITVNNIQLDSIDINLVAQTLVEYHHDFNGSQAPTVDRFYGSMGCNGTMTLKFSTPVYLWLLENM